MEFYTVELSNILNSPLNLFPSVLYCASYPSNESIELNLVAPILVYGEDAFIVSLFLMNDAPGAY